MDIEPELLVKHYGQLRSIAKDNFTLPPDVDSNEKIGQWWYGESGTGKTYAATTENPSAYRKAANNKWWDNYKGEEVIIIDDLDKKHEYMGYHLKIWGDRYSFIAEIKGSAIPMRPKKIIVTSNYHPKDIWGNDVEGFLKPILRRFHVVHFQRLANILNNSSQEEEVRTAWCDRPISTVDHFVPPPIDNFLI
jgi:hypothetical protein